MLMDYTNSLIVFFCAFYLSDNITDTTGKGRKHMQLWMVSSSICCSWPMLYTYSGETHGLPSHSNTCCQAINPLLKDRMGWWGEGAGQGRE